MKVSYNWLQEYFDKPLPNPKDLADLLNIRAFEVEEIEERDGDSVLEIKITPDRAPDCLSHLGVAREVAIHTGLTLESKPIEKIAPQFDSSFAVNAEDKSMHRYMAREVRDVVVGESPLELKLKLEAIGQRSINTIVDITNIVMYEIGQPMHAFDADKITGKTIMVGAPKNLKITTLDSKEVELTAEDLTIQDDSDNLAIAGVKGGNKTEVNSATRNILLESANFFPVKVRKASKRTGIQTDSSKRFENGLSPVLADKAIHLASQYIAKYASSEATQFSNIIDVYPRPQPRPYSVGLDLRNVSKRLGAQISDENILSILDRVGIKCRKFKVKENVLKLAHEAIDKPYIWGASVLYDAPNNGFDCSSLTSYVYSQSGIQVPRVSIDQCLFTPEIKKEDLEPGDLVFANTGLFVHADPYYDTKEFLAGTRIEHGVDHVGIYIGDNKVLHAGSKIGKVAIEDMDESAYFKNKVKYGRLAEKDEERYVLEIPYERLDLKIEEDLVEEIGRVYGYEQVTPAAPVVAAQSDEPSVYDKIATIKSHLVDRGFDEVVTYSFQKKGDIAVSKPLAKDKGFLRTDLAKGLTDALDLNFRNKEFFAEDTVRMFEVGHVFAADEERIVLGIAVRSASKKQKPKMILDEALAYLSDKTGIPFAAQIADNQEVIEIDLATILVSDININNTLSVLPSTRYVPFSPYPFMTRDVAVWAKSAKSQADIEKIITNVCGHPREGGDPVMDSRLRGSDILVRYDLFDLFTKDDRTSYAYRLVFQSHERTLTDDEINPIMDSIYATLQSDPDFEIR